MPSLLVNLLLYQVGWFACVCGAAWGHPWWGTTAAGLLLGIHFWLTDQRGRHLQLSLWAALVGCCVDTLLLAADVFRFPSGHPISFLPPPWIVLMWAQFATLLPFCFSWMRGRYLLAAALGLTGGPVAFLAGERLGAVSFLPPRVWHFLLLGLCWAVATPLLVYLTDGLFGVDRTKM